MSQIEEASDVVAEMIELGARFVISDSGPNGEDRWQWSPKPEVMRGAIRRFWRSIEPRPSDTEMVEAIRRVDREGAHAVR